MERLQIFDKCWYPRGAVESPISVLAFLSIFIIGWRFLYVAGSSRSRIFWVWSETCSTSGALFLSGENVTMFLLLLWFFRTIHISRLILLWWFGVLQYYACLSRTSSATYCCKFMMLVSMPTSTLSRRESRRDNRKISTLSKNRSAEVSW